MWTNVPQFIYYRLKAWNVVSTPPRASNLPLKGYLAHLYTTMLQDHIDLQCSTPRERVGFSETDSTQYCNSRNTQNQNTKFNQMEAVKVYLRHTDMNKLKTSKAKHPEG